MTMIEIAQLDGEAALVEQVVAAREARTPQRVRGGGSKGFYGNAAHAEAELDVRTHQGVVAYEPSELAITVRGGTPLAAVEALLAEHGQQFPFEPPHFGPGATVGGMVAAGLSGPRRPYGASVRDAVLGVRLLNGEGKAMDFGGRVMKNVAGYDLSRLMAGSLGILGVLLTVSLKVAPVPAGRMTLVQEQSLDGALVLLKRWSRRSLPITGTAWLDGRLYVRICGSAEGLKETHQVIGGLPLTEADAFWTDLREHRLSFFGGEAPLWARNSELFYWRGNRLFAVQIGTEPELSIGEPEALFSAERYTTNLSREYDVSADGLRALIARTADASKPREAKIVLNWFTELERLAGPGGGQ